MGNIEEESPQSFKNMNNLLDDLCSVYKCPSVIYKDIDVEKYDFPEDINCYNRQNSIYKNKKFDKNIEFLSADFPNTYQESFKKLYNNLVRMKSKVYEEKVGSQTPIIQNNLDLLNQLIAEFGLPKVIDSLILSKDDKNTKLDNALQNLIEYYGNEKVSYFLIKNLFSYFNSKYENIIINKANISKSSKKNKFPEKKNKILKVENFITIPIKDHITETSSAYYEGGNSNSKINDFGEKNLKKYIVEEKASNLYIIKTIVIGDNNKKKKSKCIGSHFQKFDNGEIYKYRISDLIGKDFAVFKCHDVRCDGKEHII